MRIYKLAAAIELALVLLEAAMHWAGLPLGDGHAQQIGIVFGSAFILSEISPGCRRLHGIVLRKIKHLCCGVARKTKGKVE
jgi:hypothetical protein